MTQRLSMKSATILIRFCLAFLMVTCIKYANAHEDRVPESRLGINLSGLAAWNSELPLVDVFRSAQRWASNYVGGAWNHGPELELDENGWVTRIEPDCVVYAGVCLINDGRYPAGDYTILWDGSGELDTYHAGKEIQRESNRLVVRVIPKNGFYVRLSATDPDDYIRNIRVILPGFENTYEENPWNPSLLERWRGIDTIRFMGWMKTNNAPASTWADAPTLDDATFSEFGVPVELMADLCNRLEANAWFNIPHTADDDYVRNFAERVQLLLDADLSIYLEYSNETWNSRFASSNYTRDMGLDLELNSEGWIASARYTALRSRQIFEIFDDVFDDRDRIVRVLGVPAYNLGITRQLLGSGDIAGQVDAIAIAPYMGFHLSETSNPRAAAVEKVWSVAQILKYFRNKSLPNAIDAMKAQKRIADEFGVRLIAYEGGQSIVVDGASQKRKKLIAKITQANRHIYMGKYYNNYLAAWERECGDLFCHLTSVSSPAPSGCWGSMESAKDNPRKAYKYLALMNWARRLGQDVPRF